MTDLKISTMTIVSKFGMAIELEKVYNDIELDSSLVCIEFGSNPQKGDNKKKTKKIRKTTTPKKSFYNQATLHFMDKTKTNGKPINMKIFNNGSCQLTGVPNIESAQPTIDKTRELLVKNNIMRPAPENFPLDICLINSGFSLREIVDRENFFIILEQKYNFYVNYEPDSYPGINLKYYWNDLTQNDPDLCGRCCCEEYCEGKGTGCGDTQCRRISIMIFQSGQVIITGCCTVDKLKFIHKFIIKLFNENK